eukprot:229118-Prorocentrum_minimum.AAC.1
MTTARVLRLVYSLRSGPLAVIGGACLLLLLLARRSLAYSLTRLLAYVRVEQERKPRGYWDSLANMSLEVSQFVEDRGLEPGLMPTRTALEKAG